MPLDIEIKHDSNEKLAAIAGKPTENYLFAEDVNKIVEAFNNLEENVEGLSNDKPFFIANFILFLT